MESNWEEQPDATASSPTTGAQGPTPSPPLGARPAHSAAHSSGLLATSHEEEPESLGDLPQAKGTTNSQQANLQHQRVCNLLEEDVHKLEEHFRIVIGRMRTESSTLQQERSKSNIQLDKEKRKMQTEIDEEWQKLREEKVMLQEMQKLVKNYEHDQPLRVRVGDEIFVTSRGTLSAESASFLSAVVSGDFKIESTADSDVFIDRDPKYFPLILSHLRSLRAAQQRIVLQREAKKEHASDGSSSGENTHGGVASNASYLLAHQVENIDTITAWPSDFTDEDKEECLKEAEFYGLQQLQMSLEKKILVVSDKGITKYRRVSEALQDARNGDQITVTEGIYYDSFVLMRSVDIVGQGNRQEIIIRSPVGNVIESRCRSGSIQNLTLECFPQDYGAEQAASSICGDYYGILITEGCVRVENCEIRCVGLSGVKVVGCTPASKAGRTSVTGGQQDNEDTYQPQDWDEDADEMQMMTYPILKGNDIHDAHQCGVLVTNGALADIQYNNIHHNRFSGVEVRNKAKPKLVGNQIFENVQNGIYIHSDGEGLVDTNHLYKNKFNGLNGEGKVIVTNNVIHENAKRGIFYGRDIMLKANEVYWNQLGDIAPRR